MPANQDFSLTAGSASERCVREAISSALVSMSSQSTAAWKRFSLKSIPTSSRSQKTVDRVSEDVARVIPCRNRSRSLGILTRNQTLLDIEPGRYVSGVYAWNVYVSSKTNITVSGLGAETRYFFVVTAVPTEEQESCVSNEVAYRADTSRVSMDWQFERRELQLGHATGVEVLRCARPEQGVPDGLQAFVISGVTNARQCHMSGVRHGGGDLFIPSSA